MLGKFQEFMLRHQMVETGMPSLLGVSGGVDSVVLCHLYKKSGLPFAIAHCNFKLRGVDSDEDEQFITALANQLSVQCYKIAFDTKNISNKEKSSIQLTARKLRYQWFHEVASENNYPRIVTAHHINDRIETFLYNFTKGTGIRGLRSIAPKTDNIIRPLLFASKEDILAYAKKNKLAFREDVSNLSVKYSRNKIRIEAVPVLKSINPALEQTAFQTFQNLEETEQLYLWAIDQHRKELLREQNGNSHIDLFKLKTTVAPTTLLYELISPYGFSAEQVNQILDQHTRPSGAQFYTENYRLVTNRAELIITALPIQQHAPILLQETDKQITLLNQEIKISSPSKLPDTYPLGPNIVWLDADQLSFPLTLRPWQAGDYFYPLGMAGQRQKLKKFFTNQKAALPEKEKTLVLVSRDQICWVVGWRIDERFKITEQTERGICLEIINQSL